MKLKRFLVRYKVNGTSLLGATHLEAVRSLRGIGEDLSLLVCDGFDPAQVPAGQSWMASPVASINSGSGRTQSEESLDREPLVPTSERAYDDIKKEIRRQVGWKCFYIFTNGCRAIFTSFVVILGNRQPKKGKYLSPAQLRLDGHSLGLFSKSCD